jgi:hypothetical protein
MRSAAKTPNWAVKELATKISVFTRANGTFRICVSLAQIVGAPARREKYIANKPAKNITSLPNQTMVPTDVALGLLITAPDAGKEVADMSQF